MTEPSGTPFLLIVFDTAQATFSVEGPVSDDRAWQAAIAAACVDRATVGYHACLDGGARMWRRTAAQEFRERTGYRRVAMGSIVQI
ncbi:hypothetical protein EBBID32_32990 [Sphingobium indicum BiD32]|uniref:Uncharacterized protein n=1 Tax=Sphingobium indicum BiD32 TaxID=1301087 RepID=N1MTE4_9SPHN|nr:hypothetical protein [Sphingobium indicum]CCW18942.1 hypothetical protein EBBID32_32990 [Sphingobium indicum BiD32]